MVHAHWGILAQGEIIEIGTKSNCKIGSKNSSIQHQILDNPGYTNNINDQFLFLSQFGGRGQNEN